MFTIKNTKQQARELAATIIASKVTPVFDLDGVVVDASHRQICNPDGSLNLDKYREMSTAEYISKDKELPLLETIQILNDNGVDYHVCTARIMCENTQKWLKARNVKAKSVMARSHGEDSRRDARLKTVNLETRFTRRQRENMVLIDDNVANCQAVKTIGMKAINVPFAGH